MSAVAGAAPNSPSSYDQLPSNQRALLVGAIVGVHAAAAWGLLQVCEVRMAVAEAAPMFVDLIAPEQAPVVPPPPPRPTAPTRERPRALPRLIDAPPSPSPAPEVAPVLAPPSPAVVEAPAALPPAPLAVAVPAPPAPPPAPKVIPASAVQYLEPLATEYPRVSRRLGETGRVLVRVFIDESGAARHVQLHRSSSHPRLDDAAVAAVQKARFRPYTENGQAVAGWAYIPIDFELEP